jgi:hypothetical protein
MRERRLEKRRFLNGGGWHWEVSINDLPQFGHAALYLPGHVVFTAEHRLRTRS